ncbi:MAG: DMT family transporter [Prochlorothrix sp.]
MLGFCLVLVASLFFCVQNVIVRILMTPSQIGGWLPISSLFGGPATSGWETGGFVEPRLASSFLLLALRTWLSVPLMAAIADRLYDGTWREIRSLGQRQNRRLLGQTLGGGGLMFLYLVLLYFAIGLIPTGIALTLFFTYPSFTALISWFWFGTRPSVFRWSVMAAIFLGSVLTVLEDSTSGFGLNPLGIALGIGSGVAYALYTVNAQICFRQIHPVPFTGLSFGLTLVLSSLFLLIWPLVSPDFGGFGLNNGPIDPDHWLPLWIGSLLSAVMTVTAHLLTNLGIRAIGATSAALLSATNPTLTVILAWVLLQEQLQPVHLVGVAIVTTSVALLGREYQPDRASSA